MRFIVTSLLCRSGRVFVVNDAIQSGLREWEEVISTDVVLSQWCKEESKVFPSESKSIILR